jgi:hypothetical protein
MKQLLPASLWDVLTSTDKGGKVRFDARKCWECGAFWASTIWGCILLYKNDLSEWYFTGYLAAWVFARSMRDREQRLMTQGKPKSK